MPSSANILREISKKLLRHGIVLRVEFLGTKVRAHLIEGFILDVYYNATLEKYSYSLVKQGHRILGWDNAPHHIRISTYPHHYHDADGSVKPSNLTGNLENDLNKVMKLVEKYIKSRSLS